MSLALLLGRRGLGRTWPNPAVGAVVARQEGGASVIVGRGWTQPGGRPHAETEALARTGAAAGGATAYVSLEPCAHLGHTPPCAARSVSILTGVPATVTLLKNAPRSPAATARVAAVTGNSEPRDSERTTRPSDW